MMLVAFMAITSIAGVNAQEHSFWGVRLAIVIALFIIKDNIASEDDVEKKLGLPVLGVLPYDLALDDEKVNNKKETKGGKK